MRNLSLAAALAAVVVAIASRGSGAGRSRHREWNTARRGSGRRRRRADRRHRRRRARGRGGAVRGAVGTATGVVGDVLGANERPRFREYVMREHIPSYRYAEPLRPGVVLPGEGVTYREVPREYGARPGYRYTVVNERPVIVDPVTRAVVDVLD